MFQAVLFKLSANHITFFFRSCSQAFQFYQRDKGMSESKRRNICAKEIVTTVRQLELFPDEGPCLQDLIEYPTDYHYLVVKPNYIFYRIKSDTVRVIRILNEKQDFLHILFGISSISEKEKEYWSTNE